MWVRKRLDIGWIDLIVAMIHCGLPDGGPALRRCVEELWSRKGDALACLSVRSGFDLLLDVLAFPPKSEVLVSALTIPDMVRIVEDRGLVPVPVDLAVETAGPKLESLRRAITPASKAILVAHLFGGRLELEPIAAIAREHGLTVIEDCAQAFDGGRYLGHPEADVSMFSFGPIKTATALGGAVLRVRDADLLRRMRQHQASWPIQARSKYLSRILKYSLLKALSSRLLFDLLVRTWRVMGRDHDRLVNGSVRGFAGSGFFERIRQRPPGPLLALLRRRLAGYVVRRLARRTANGQLLVSLLDGAVVCPGREMSPHSHWVFPILAQDPQRVIAALRKAGFDATQGESMCVVPPPPDRPEVIPSTAVDLLAKIVYLPNYPEIPERAVRKMAKVVLRVMEKPATLDRGSPGSRDRGEGLADAVVAQG